MKQMTLVRLSVEPFLEVYSSIFFIKFEIANALQDILTQYVIIMVQFLAGLRKIKLRTALLCYKPIYPTDWYDAIAYFMLGKLQLKCMAFLRFWPPLMVLDHLDHNL